jgi:hypothetical protein
MPINPFFDHYAHLLTFPDQVLRDLARNESAPYDYRKFAVEQLLKRRSPFARHTDLVGFIQEIEGELDGIQTDFPAPEITPPEPMRASVTTSTMFGGDVIDMEALRALEMKSREPKFTGFDDVQLMDKPHHRFKTIRKKSDAEKVRNEQTDAS